MEKIFLIGFMASGKSIVGRIVASKLGWAFADMDTIIEARMGKSISDIFAEAGEDSFREVERAVLAELLDSRHVIVATGGGVPVYYDNMSRMMKRGFVVYLNCPDSVILSRLSRARDQRPLASCMTQEKLSRLREFREPYYEAAHYQVRCGTRSPQAIAAEIADTYRSWKKLAIN